MAVGFLGSTWGELPAKVAILGVPFDSTASYRAGSRFGPQAIRQGSLSLEMYSPFLSRGLVDLDFTDLGDLDVPPGSAARMVDAVQEEVERIISTDTVPALLGGEHTITLGAIRALFKKYPTMHLLQLDAHTDLREEWMGERINHATVIKRIMDFLPAEHIHRLGIRSGTKEEWELARIPLPLENGNRDITNVMHRIPENVPLYITVDLDVFDPSLMPGTGNPEPMGITYREFIQLIRLISEHNIIGFDVVELAPQFDPSGVSSIVAASVMREMLLSMVKQ